MNVVTESLNEFGRWLAALLWPMSVELAILTLLVIAVLALLRPSSPAVRHAFWCLVLIKPLTTILVASPASFFDVLKPEPPQAVMSVPLADREAVERPAPRAAWAATARRAYEWRPSPNAPLRNEPDAALDRYGLMSLCYLIVAASLALRLVAGLAYVSVLCHRARSLRHGPLADLLAQTARKVGVHRCVVLAVSRHAHVPLLAGIWRPTVLLPHHAAARLSQQQLEYILAHELTHARRWDNLVLLAQRVAETLLFFHPSVWLCGRALRREAEAACDDAVVRRLAGPAEYADSLTRTAEIYAGLSRRLLVNTFASAESSLAVRVRQILRGPVRRMSGARLAASFATLAAMACLGLPAAQARTVKLSAGQGAGLTATKGELTMSSAQQYGFRYDPMLIVENDASVEGAIIRTLVFEQAKPGDEALMQDELGSLKVLVKPDAEEEGCAVNAENLLRAVRLGADENHPEVRRALDLLDVLPQRPREPITGGALHALCVLGRADHPIIQNSVRMSIEAADEWIKPLSGCPWTPSGALPALWAAREAVDTTEVVERGLRGIHDRMDDTGCLGFMDPWSFVNCAASIDLPVAREILVKQIPMLLRAQQPDGGWGEHTFKVLAALKRHNLLDELRARPPLPPDWKVVRSVPAPEDDLWGIVWDGQRLWTGLRSTNEAVALSPEDGRIVSRVKLPDGYGRWLGWWDDRLAVTQGSPRKQDAKRLLQLDPGDGRLLQEVSLDKLEHVGGVVQLGAELWVFDAFFGSEYVLDSHRPRRPTQTHDDGTLPVALTVTANPAGDQSMWCVDAWSPWIIKTRHDRKLLDWGERPFGSIAGVAWDGTQLWAVDEANRRFCVIEKTDTAPRPTA